MHPVVASRVTDTDLKWMPQTYLSKLNDQTKTSTVGDKVHRVRVSVMGTGLQKDTVDAVKSCVKVFDTKTGKHRAPDAKGTLKSKSEKLVFSLPIFVKDHSNLHSNQVNIMHIVDSGAEGASSFFPGVTLQDILKSKPAQTKVLTAL